MINVQLISVLHSFNHMKRCVKLCLGDEVLYFLLFHVKITLAKEHKGLTYLS